MSTAKYVWERDGHTPIKFRVLMERRGYLLLIRANPDPCIDEAFWEPTTSVDHTRLEALERALEYETEWGGDTRRIRHAIAREKRKVAKK